MQEQIQQPENKLNYTQSQKIADYIDMQLNLNKQ